MGSKGDMESKIGKATLLSMDEINNAVNKNKEQGLQRLLTLVCNIKPELHQNYQA